MTVRPEQPADHDAARMVHRSAFGENSPEAGLVDALRAAGSHVAELCLVAESAGEVVGHIFFSRARLDSGDDVLALAPMAVLPEWQRQGVGSRLVEASLQRAAETNYPLVVVVGHPSYYPRFGFEPAGGHGIVAPWDIPPEAWMVHRLPAYRREARGTVTYPEAFDAVT